MGSRRPPNTPGWQIPVAYQLKWLALALIIFAVVGSCFLLWLPPNFLALSASLGVGITLLLKYWYEHSGPDDATTDHDSADTAEHKAQ